MEELLKYIKELLFKFLKNKWMALLIYIIILITIFFKEFFLEGLNTLNSNNILNFYNLPKEIIGVKYIEFWQLLFAVLLILAMILHPKIFLKDDLIFKIIFEIAFSALNSIIILIIVIKFLENNSIITGFLLKHFNVIFIILIFLILFAVLELKNLKEICYWLEIYWLKFKKLKEIININKIKRKIKEIKFNELICNLFIFIYFRIFTIIFLFLIFCYNIYIFINILIISILLIILKIYKLKIFLLLKTIGINILLLIPLYSFFNISNKGPEDKREYFYSKKEKGIISVVVYEKEEDYIIQNAKIIKTYSNKKILILDTRSFYIINKKDLYNKEIQVGNFDEVIKGIVMSNEEAKMRQEL